MLPRAPLCLIFSPAITSDLILPSAPLCPSPTPHPPKKDVKLFRSPPVAGGAAARLLTLQAAWRWGALWGNRGSPLASKAKQTHCAPPLPKQAMSPQSRPPACRGPLCFPKAIAAQQAPQPRGDINLPCTPGLGGVCVGGVQAISVCDAFISPRPVCVCVCVPAPPRPGWVCSGAQWPLRPHCGRTKPRDTRPREGTAAAQTSPAPPPPPLLSCEGARCGRLSPAGTALPAPGEREKGRGRA